MDQPARTVSDPATAPGGPPEPAARTGRLPGWVWLIAAAFVALELALSGRYGFQQDELYFLVAGHHLALGYVDQPPLTPLITRLMSEISVSPAVDRIVPALAVGVVILIAARLAALFGGGRLSQVIAALATACAPVILGAAHTFTTTPLDLLAWALILLCVSTALLAGRPRWWLGAGLAAGIGLENKNLLVFLVGGLLLGVLISPRYRGVLRTRWPWLGGLIALAIWLPNLAWQATHGWPQLVMAAALHQENSSAGSYLGALPVQLVYPGLLTIPVLIAGFVALWRRPGLRFIAVACTIIVVYVVVWVPGKGYYSDGMVPAVLAAGGVATEGWVARGRRPRLRRALIIAAPLVSAALLLPSTLPVLPVASLHTAGSAVTGDTTLTDSVGWPQFTATVAREDAALTRAGERPTAIFTGWYGEAAALGVLGQADHLPPVLSGHNAYWTWGPGQASDRTVLVVDALGWLRPHFAHCHLLTTYYTPYHLSNDWTDLPIGVCTGPKGPWSAFWPSLKHFQ